jgi:hypothetical protein
VSRTCSDMIEFCWDDETQTSDSLDKVNEKWLRGRDLNPRPLGYEPTESGHQLPLETIRPVISSCFCHQWSVVATRFYSPVSRKCPATTVACAAMAMPGSVRTRPVAR